MARRSFCKKWWMVLVLLSALLIGYQTIYGWYRLAKDTAKGPQPPQRYDRGTDPGSAFSFSDRDDPGRASVWVDNTTVIVFRSSYRGQSPAQRARAAADVIQDFIQEKGAVADVTVDENADGRPTVALNGETVAVVDDETARANDTTAEALAHVWAENLRAALRREE